MGQVRRDGRRACFIAQVADHTGKVVTRGFDRKTDMWEFESMMRVRRQRIRAGLEAPFEPILVKKYVSAWLIQRKLGKKSSWAGDVTKLENFWLPKIGDRILHTLTRTEIERHLDSLIADGLSPAYRNRHRALLHKLFQDAIRHEPPHATHNPVTRIPQLSEKTKVRHYGFLTQREEALGYVAGYRTHGPQWGILAAIMAFSGARIDEAVVMKWMDFDWERMVIAISRIWEIKSKKIQDRTKGQREGGTDYVLLLPELKRMLLEWQQATRFGAPSDFIVCDARGRHYTYWQAKRIHDAVVTASPALPKITPHGFRHFFGRYLRSLGFQSDDLKGIMRHTDARVTERYSPIDMRHLVDKAVKLGLGFEADPYSAPVQKSVVDTTATVQ